MIIYDIYLNGDYITCNQNKDLAKMIALRMAEALGLEPASEDHWEDDDTSVVIYKREELV